MGIDTLLLEAGVGRIIPDQPIVEEPVLRRDP
jgi:hypothetical protein